MVSVVAVVVHNDLLRCASKRVCYAGDKIMSFMYDKAPLRARQAWMKVTTHGPLHEGHVRQCAIPACPAWIAAWRYSHSCPNYPVFCPYYPVYAFSQLSLVLLISGTSNLDATSVLVLALQDSCHVWWPKQPPAGVISPWLCCVSVRGWSSGKQTANRNIALHT